jgi:putative holliday junction resolvase
MKCLGMDLGTKKLGLAMSDVTGMISYPYKLIKFSNYEEAAKEVVDIVNKEKVEILVLGLPKNMDNSMGFASERSLNFKSILEGLTDKEIVLIDERLSTVEAENMLIKDDVKRKKRKNVIDELSAAIILDTYLRKVG